MDNGRGNGNRISGWKFDVRAMKTADEEDMGRKKNLV